MYVYGLNDAFKKSQEIQNNTDGVDVRNDPYAGNVKDVVDGGLEEFYAYEKNRLKLDQENK